MVKLQTFNSQEEKWKFLSAVDINRSTIVVADLDAKAKIQNIFLEKQECLPETAVLRIHEIWSSLMRRSEPDLRQVSPALVQSLLEEWLEKNRERFTTFPGTADLLAKYIGVFLPILVRRDLRANLRAWLKENPAAVVRWANWYLLAEESYDYLQSLKIISRLWVGAYLSGHDTEPNWGRALVIDIGPELKGPECDLLISLSRHHDVTLLTPAADLMAHYPEAFRVYRRFQTQKKNSKDESANNIRLTSNDLQVLRFSTQLAEVKNCVSWARFLLDSGAKPNQIGIFAANIEEYWPVLERYFNIEGIPLQKAVVASLQSFPEVMDWLSALRIYSREISTGDLENNLFVRRSKPPISFDDFQKLYTFIYDENDLGRSEVVRDLYQFRFGAQEVLRRDEFVAWSLNYWLSPERRGLERVTNQLILECPSDMKLKLSSWLKYLTNLCARGEMTVQVGDSSGVSVGNFDGALHVTQPHACLLGVSQEALRPDVDLSLSLSDVEKISSDLGVDLDHPVHSRTEFLLHQILANSPGSLILSFAATDFSGEPLSPSLIWVEQAMSNRPDLETLDFPMMGRWDGIQERFARPHAEGVPDEYANRRLAIQQDLGEVPLPKLAGDVDKSWSVSQFEKILECPFKYAAERVFQLSDSPYADLDMDPMTNGQFLHEVLRRILSENDGLSWNEQKINDLVEVVRSNYVALSMGGSEAGWLLKKADTMRLVRRFIAFEKRFRAEYPLVRSPFLEQKFDAQVPIAGRNLRVRGSIDRVDADGQGHLVVFDYKNTGQFTHATSWLGNGHLQLWFYCYLIERNLIPEVRGEVVGAFYYVLAGMNRRKGYRGPGSENLVPPKDGELLGPEKREPQYSELEAKIIEILKLVEQGDLKAIPEDETICQTCRWNGLCRAPHLN